MEEIDMAIVSSLIGGLSGFFAFLCAFFVFDQSILASLALYITVGSMLTLGLIATALIWRVVSTGIGEKPALSLPTSDRNNGLVQVRH
jgi:hypothetical protein